MLSQREAATLVKKQTQEESESYVLTFEEEKDNDYVFMLTAKDREMIPSKIAIAVNKDSGKIGSSMTDINEAINVANK